MAHHLPVLAAVSGQQPPAAINPQAQVPGAVHTAWMNPPGSELAEYMDRLQVYPLRNSYRCQGHCHFLLLVGLPSNRRVQPSTKKFPAML
ncbi:hypothetical protein M0679_000387 [Citrobacter freundii]|nr:hypothetical protein [Citrobacter freundii]